MPEFSKKPVTIEAVEFIGFQDGGVTFGDGAASHPWLDKAMFSARGTPGAIWSERRDPVPTASDPLAQRGAEMVLLIGTLEGEHIASPGDWIIRGVKGELYPCKPDIFAATYNAAGQEDPISPPEVRRRGFLQVPRQDTEWFANFTAESAPDYLSMLPGDMLAAVGTDGMKWADAFMQTACFDNPLGRALRSFPHTEPTGNERAVLHGAMLGWFCNAIEAGRSAGEQGMRRRLYPLFSEVVICEPIVGEVHLTLRYQSTQDAHAAHAALTDLAREVGILGDPVETEEAAREQLADSFAADFDAVVAEVEASPEMQALFAKGAAGAASPIAGAEPGEPTTQAEGWRDGVRVVPDARKAVEIARAFIDKHHVSCPEATVNDGVYEEAPLLVEQLAEAVGYYRDPEEA